MRGLNEVPFKNDANKKVSIDWQVSYPHIIFLYTENKNGKDVTFLDRYNLKCTMEKFGLKPEENDTKNVNTLVNRIEKCFEDNRVAMDIFQVKYYSLEFKGIQGTANRFAIKKIKIKNIIIYNIFKILFFLNVLIL